MSVAWIVGTNCFVFVTKPNLILLISTSIAITVSLRISQKAPENNVELTEEAEFEEKS